MSEMEIWNHHARLAGRHELVNNRSALEDAKRRYGKQTTQGNFWVHSMAAKAMLNHRPQPA